MLKSFLRRWNDRAEKQATKILLPVLLARGDFKSHLAAYLLVAKRLEPPMKPGAGDAELKARFQEWAETQALIAVTDKFLLENGYVHVSGRLLSWQREGFSWEQKYELGPDPLEARQARLEDILPAPLSQKLSAAMQGPEVERHRQPTARVDDDLGHLRRSTGQTSADQEFSIHNNDPPPAQSSLHEPAELWEEIESADPSEIELLADWVEGFADEVQDKFGVALLSRSGADVSLELARPIESFIRRQVSRRNVLAASALHALLNYKLYRGTLEEFVQVESVWKTLAEVGGNFPIPEPFSQEARLRYPLRAILGTATPTELIDLAVQIGTLVARGDLSSRLCAFLLRAQMRDKITDSKTFNRAVDQFLMFHGYPNAACANVYLWTEEAFPYERVDMDIDEEDPLGFRAVSLSIIVSNNIASAVAQFIEAAREAAAHDDT